MSSLSPRSRTVGQELAGPLARMWAGGVGPSHSAIDSSLTVVGLDSNKFGGNKEAKVREALSQADDQTAVDLATELVELLKAEGVFDADSDLVAGRMRQLQAAFERVGATLNEWGSLTWTTPGAPAMTGAVASASARKVAVPGVPAAPHVSGVASAADPNGARDVEVTGPSLGFLTQVLRRLPHASRPLVGTRRSPKGSVPIADEYDVQDFVHLTLRLLYPDTRSEEVAPSFAGSSSRIDFLIKAESTAVEIKVTRQGRGERVIAPEIINDQRYYQTHPHVKHLIAVVYDLVGNFKNPEGFEADLSGQINHVRNTVIVVRWPTIAD